MLRFLALGLILLSTAGFTDWLRTPIAPLPTPFVKKTAEAPSVATSSRHVMLQYQRVPSCGAGFNSPHVLRPLYRSTWVIGKNGEPRLAPLPVYAD